MIYFPSFSASSRVLIKFSVISVKENFPAKASNVALLVGNLLVNINVGWFVITPKGEHDISSSFSISSYHISRAIFPFPFPLTMLSGL